MGLIKTVTGKFQQNVENLFTFLRRNAVQFLRPFHKAVLHGNQVFHLFLAHGPAQNIGFAQGEACQNGSRLHNLFLIQHNPIGICQDSVQQRMDAFHRVMTLPALDKLVRHARV